MTVMPATPSAPPTRPAGLNPAQMEAVHAAPGPLLVLAGAGTGKTRVVIARIAHLVWRGAKPSRILAVTFTNKAAREMVTRAVKGLKKGSAEKPEISTIHSLCVRILQLMREGDKFRFTIPSELAYGARGPGPIGPNAVLIFDVELIKVLN